MGGGRALSIAPFSFLSCLLCPFRSLGFAALYPLEKGIAAAHRSLFSFSPSLLPSLSHCIEYPLSPSTSKPTPLGVSFPSTPPADKLFRFTSSWGNVSSQILPIPPGVMATLGPREAIVFSLMASGLQCDLGGGDGEGGLISFSPLPRERLQLPGLQNGEGLGLESTLQLFVERECQVSLRFLPSGIAGTPCHRS